MRSHFGSCPDLLAGNLESGFRCDIARNFRNNKNGHTLAVDAIFGPKTMAAVIAFQRAMSA
jgi:peptidoglycan hydrolase-like protein with peptidoglycan-binding domain